MGSSDSSVPQLLPDGNGNEEVKGTDEVKVNIDEDTAAKTSDLPLDMESSTLAQRLLNEGNEEVKGTDEVKVNIDEDTAAKTSDLPLDVESSTLAQRLLNEDKGKKQVQEADGVKLDVDEGRGKGQDQLKEDRGKGRELEEADGVNIGAAKDNVATASVAESSTSAERGISAEDKGKAEEQHEDEGMTEITQLERNPLPDYERSQVEWAKNLKCSIHKVHSGLRDGSGKHYEPVLLSIGPYHHNKARMEDMVLHKVHYKEALLGRVRRRVNESSSSVNESSGDQTYKNALRDETGKPHAFDCYRDTHDMMKHDIFIECMVLDGLFMIELFRRNKKPDGCGDGCGDECSDESYDILSNLSWMKPLLARDMLLFENQIPLHDLFQLHALVGPTENQGDFVKRALSFFEFNGEQIPYDVVLETPLEDIPHLLGLAYQALVYGERKNAALVQETQAQLDTETPEEERSTAWKLYKLLLRSMFERLKKAFVQKTRVKRNRETKSLELRIADAYLSLVELFSRETPEQPNNAQESWKFIRTAVALEAVGVMIVKADDDALFHGIEYEDGVLRIPRLVIDDHTESLFRNLVAYEQYSKKYSLHRVTDYLRVMDCLINTPKDVELLRHHGIIDNGIGDDDKVSTMFNHLCSGVYFDKKKFFYAKMFNDVNKFCKNHRNEWMGKLKNEYFGSPWSRISFWAAVLLLFLTTVQTVFSVLSYF